MPVPSALALTTIADGALITAAPHRSNYTAVQAAVNALIGFLDGESNGALLGFDGTDWKGMAAGGAAGAALVYDGTNWVALPSYRKTTEKDVVNTVTETDLLNGEVTIGAGVMGTNRMLRVTLIGDYLNNTGTDKTFTLKIKFGSTVLYEDPTPNITANAIRRPLWFEFMIANLGAANSQFMHGRYRLGAASGATTGTGDLSFGDFNGASFAMIGTAALDTTTSKLLEVTVTHSAASASLSARLKYALVEVL